MNHNVSIRKVNRSIKSTLAQALRDIGGLPGILAPDDKVLLKPNINGNECVTNIQVVEAFLEILHDHSIQQIMIAESTFGNARMTRHWLKQNGYFALQARWNFDLVNLNASEVVEIPVQSPLVKQKLRIAKEVIAADKIVNLPVMKVHYATGITMCLKNLKGILVGDEKRTFHEIGLNEAIVDLNRTIRPALNIVDGTHCMERMGPKGGDIVDLNLILTGVQSACVDYVGMQIMGYTLREVDHLALFVDAENIDLAQIRTLGETIEAVKYDFEKVNLQVMREHQLNIQNNDACSSCMNALILSIMSSPGIDFSHQTIYLGSKFTSTDDARQKIAFGKCGIASLDHSDYQIRGCPPFPFELQQQLEKG